MDARFRTVIHRFGISKGIPQERPLNITVVEGASLLAPRRNRGSLYILVEVLGALPDPDYTVKRLADVIRTEYYKATGSITGGIGAALRAANDLLFEENLSSAREERGVAGVSCAVLREGELYLGQLGPALAYLAQADGLRRFPEESPWLRQAVPTNAERAASPPIGVRRVVEPAFYHATMAEGDTLVLASPALARMTTSRMVAEAVALGGPDAAEQLLKLAAGRDLSVLMVTLEAGGQVPAWADEEEEPTEVEVAPREEEVEEQPETLQPRPPLTVPRSPRVGAGSRQGYERAPSQKRPGLLEVLRSLLPDRPPQGQAVRRTRVAGGPRRRTNGRTVALLATLVPILVVLLVVVTRCQYDRSRRLQVENLLRQAEEARTAGVNSGQKATLREGLQRAIGLIDQALVVAPQEGKALRLRQEMADQLDEASSVQRLYTLWELADFAAAADSPAQPTQIIVRAPEVFVLDRGTSRVYRRMLSPAGDALEPLAADAVLVQKGETRGAIVVGELLDMVWMPPGGERKTENLLILERNGSLLQWDASQGITVLPVADSAAWKKPQAAGAYSGNFYLLDPIQNRILKYVPKAGGYTAPPVDYLPNPPPGDLSGAVDMAIDGHIYVLLADGTILKFLMGNPQPFHMSDLDMPLSNPVAIAVTGEDEAHGSLYVADAGLARVVQFTKQGEFVRQYKAGDGQATLAKLHGLFVDEGKQRIYLTSGSKLYMAPLAQAGPGLVPTETATSAP